MFSDIAYHDGRARIGHGGIGRLGLEGLPGPVPCIICPGDECIILAAIVPIIGNVKEPDEVLLIGDDGTLVILVGHAPNSVHAIILCVCVSDRYSHNSGIPNDGYSHSKIVPSGPKMWIPGPH